MERIKRQLDDNVYDYNDNKKQKVENELIINKSCFENLPNETIYEIFQYLDVYHIYEGFFYLNQRFESLVLNTNPRIQINITTLSKSNLDRYHKNMMKPNKHRINYLRLSNPFTVDIIFSPPRVICDYIQLETLIFDNIDAKYLQNILKHLVYLQKLQSLVISLADYLQNPGYLFHLIFRLPKLKYCEITYQSHYDPPLPIYMAYFTPSPIEYLVINNSFSINSLCDIFLRLSKLRYLSIECLVGYINPDLDQHRVSLEYLKYVSMKVDNIRFHVFQELVEHFFGRVEVLHLTIHDPIYLNPNRWKELISSSMPNLRIFDIYHTSTLENNQLISLLSVYGFSTSFWSERQWFFTHQHDQEKKLNCLIFYSTKPYRRKDYTLDGKSYSQLSSRTQQNNFKSVKHVQLCSVNVPNNTVNYFPNVNELTLEDYFNIFDDSISTTLHRIVPLRQLTKLVIKSSNFPFEQIINLIRFTPNLHALKLDLLFFNGTDLKLIQQSESFRIVSNTNKIKSIELREPCTLETFQMIINVFSQVEYLKTAMNRKEIKEITRYLSLKTNHGTHRLFFLCISQIPKVCLRELNVLIKSENLFNDYSIKYIIRDLYLWW